MTGPRHYSMFDETMWASAGGGALRLQCCAHCGHWRYPPGAACPSCLSTEARWEKISGRGMLLSWTTFHRQYLPAYPAPTTCVAVKLEEGPIVIGNIDADETASLRVDMPIFLIYGRHPDGYVLPRFTIDQKKAGRLPPPAPRVAAKVAVAQKPAAGRKKVKSAAKKSAVTRGKAASKKASRKKVAKKTSRKTAPKKSARKIVQRKAAVRGKRRPGKKR